MPETKRDAKRDARRKQVILCVDDDRDVLDNLKIVLESGGYEMIQAMTAEEALKVARSRRPDLFIIDLMMEEIDAGVGLVKSLKAEGFAAPVYMLSSVGDNLNLSTDYAELGLSGVFQKPIEPKALLSILKTRLK